MFRKIVYTYTWALELPAISTILECLRGYLPRTKKEYCFNSQTPGPPKIIKMNCKSLNTKVFLLDGQKKKNVDVIRCPYYLTKTKLRVAYQLRKV